MEEKRQKDGMEEIKVQERDGFRESGQQEESLKQEENEQQEESLRQEESLKQEESVQEETTRQEGNGEQEETPRHEESQQDKNEKQEDDRPREERKRDGAQEKREARRKRRLKSQILSYVVLVLLLLMVAGLAAFGINSIRESRENREAAIQSSQAMLDTILGEEESIQTPDPEQEQEEVVELTAEQKLDEIVNESISVMPLEDKVAGLFIVTPEAITGVSTAVMAGEGTQKALNQYAVGGILYSSKNIQSEEQITEMLDNTELYSKYPIFLAVEEEGGSTAPVAAAGIGENTDSAKTIGESGDTQAAYAAGQSIGAVLKGLGFNLDLAPVADLTSVADSVMEGRAFSSDAATAGAMAGSMLQGLKEQGITSCLKYFPGLGGSTQDPNKGLATIDRTLEEFYSEEMTAYQAAIDAGADMVMVTTASAPNLTGDNDPCVFSSSLVTDILRKEMGFDGVIITDDLSMTAVVDYYDSADAAIMAIKAGCDMILNPEDFEESYNGVLQAVQDGIISEERVNDALKRIYRIKYRDKYASQIEEETTDEAN